MLTTVDGKADQRIVIKLPLMCPGRNRQLSHSFKLVELVEHDHEPHGRLDTSL